MLTMNDEINTSGITDTLVITKRFRSPNEFSLHIENMVLKKRMTYMEAILDYCSEVDIDIESIEPLINTNLKEKIKLEAQENRLIKPSGRLPI